MKSKFALFILFLIILLTPLSVTAQQQAKEITGKVTGATQDPKGFAGVTFNGPNRYVTMTNSTGEFTVKNVKRGRYTVTVSQGNKKQSFNVDIDGMNSLDLRVRW